MQARYLISEDYDTLCKWWNDNRFTPPLIEMLPENGCGGIMISSEGRDVCAGFLYLTNSKCAWVEWIVCDFNYRESDRSECILFLINALSELAKQSNYEYLYTVVKNKHLIGKYEQCGFIKGDSNSQEMILKI